MEGAQHPEVDMHWKILLKQQAEAAYRAAEGLFDLVDDSTLAWKPESGTNWLTTGQLLKHITGACGAMCKGFVSGDWGAPPETFETMSSEEMLPPAEKLPTSESVAEAKVELAADKAVAFEMIAQASDEEIEKKTMTAPWDPSERPLGDWITQSIVHLVSHKAQLYYYLKLQGADVNTGHLWGM